MRKSLFLAFILYAIFSACSPDKTEYHVAAKDSIPVSSDFIKTIINLVNLKPIAHQQDDVREDEANTFPCIQINHTLTIYVYNADYSYINYKIFNSNIAFSTFLENLPEDKLISISYPIYAKQKDGNTVEINNNNELRLALNACNNDEIVRQCYTTLTQDNVKNCKWQVTINDALVTSAEANDNTYNNATFIMNRDRTTTFKVENNFYQGTWNSLLIDNLLHININLLNAGQVGDDWNYNWKAHLINDESIKLERRSTDDNGEPITVVKYLNKICVECSDLEFENCAKATSPNQAEFKLNNFTECIRESIGANSKTLKYTFYETLTDLENQTNAINANVTYLNTSNPQTIHVLVENTANQDTYKTTLQLKANTCN